MSVKHMYIFKIRWVTTFISWNIILDVQSLRFILYFMSQYRLLCQTISYGIYIQFFLFSVYFTFYYVPGKTFFFLIVSEKCNAAILKCAGCIPKEGSNL